MLQNFQNNQNQTSNLNKEYSNESCVSSSESHHSTNSSDGLDSVNLEAMLSWSSETGMPQGFVQNLIANTLSYDALLSQYCLWDTENIQNLFQMSNNWLTNLIPEYDFKTSNIYNNGIWKPQPISNNSSIYVNQLVKTAIPSIETSSEKNSTQLINRKSVYESSNMGERKESEDKSSYIKAIFHITRVNKKTKKQTRVNRHRHVISHWEHVGAPYYARGMCKKCYFSKGKRKKNAYKCAHKDRSHYATGLCKLWYLKNYHKNHDRKKARDI